LGYWSSKMVEHEQAVERFNAEGGEMPADEPVFLYLGIYALLTIAAAFSVSVRGATIAVGCFKASLLFHDRMLENVVRAPISFFDTTPTGRILNRFSSDQYVVDNDLRQNISMLMMCVLRVLFVGFVIFYVTPVFIVVVIPLGGIYFYVQKFYRESSRELKRLESVAKSPIFAQFSETLNGVATIRSFCAQSRFTDKSNNMNDAYSRAYYCNNASNRWLGLRLEFIGNVAVGCAALFAVIWNGDDPSTAGMIGLSVTYALDVTGTLNWAIRTFTQLESNMVAVERLEEYAQLKTEKPDIIESERPPAEWPQHGVLAFENVEMRYRDDLGLALKGITFATCAGEKIGVVGRTGAGKSSLAVALFRISEVCGGRVLLDGIDVSRIGLADLRSRLSIIPQDPVLFAGTVRSNLDPFGEFSASELWQALERVHLKPFLQDAEDGLAYAVTEGGANLSVGQRQLMCMARALLRRAKVIIMDEATASVDMQTDALIQVPRLAPPAHSSPRFPRRSPYFSAAPPLCSGCSRSALT
jgi:ABC-type multidrug transport system fused ATPase/permease subunit